MALRDWFKASAPIETTETVSPLSDNSHLETLTLAELYGVAPSELPVTRASAMAVASVYKARSIITNNVARMPIVAMKNGVPLATQPAMLTQLQAGVPNFVTVSWIVDGLMFFGRAYLLIEARGFDGRPSNLRFAPEWEIEVKDGILIRAFGKPVARGNYVRIDFNSEGFLSYGKEVLREAIEIERVAREAGANPVPSLVLKAREGADLTQAQVTELLAQWNAARRKKYGSVGYLNKAVDLESVGQQAENLLIDGRNQASLQVARALGLPAWAVDANVQGQSLNYSNAASRNREILDALTPYIETIEGYLSLWLPLGTQAKFDTAELLRQDTKGRYEEYEIAIRAGFMLPEEARSREHMDPLPETKAELSATEEASKVNALGVLVRSGFDPKDASKQLGLPEFEHLGLLPVTLQPPAEGTDLENAVPPVEEAPQEPTVEDSTDIEEDNTNEQED